MILVDANILLYAEDQLNPQHEVARAYDLSQSRISRLVARFRREGEAAFAPRSRRPSRSPTAIPQATVELICQLRRDLASQGLDVAGFHGSGALLVMVSPSPL